MEIGTDSTVAVIRVQGLLRTIGWAIKKRIPVATAIFQVANNTRSRAIIGLTDVFTRNVNLESSADKRERMPVIGKVYLRLDTDVDRKRRSNIVVIRLGSLANWLEDSYVFFFFFSIAVDVEDWAN